MHKPIVLLKTLLAAGILASPFAAPAQAPGTVVPEPVEPYLAAPAAGALYEVPVAIIRYLPTRNGRDLDAGVTDVSGSLEQIRRRIDRINRQVKFILEEGSRFRGYQDPSSRPSLGYRVVASVSVYEALPEGRVAPGSERERFPDYAAIVNRFDGKRLVDELGVKEFWIWGYHTATVVPAESKMSSQLTGDISNSHRFNDLPIFGRSYVVYNYNYGRTAGEAVHNRGHQLEAILSYVARRQDGNDDLFWQKFVGRNSDNRTFGVGRAGWTHMPPNTNVDYDYANLRTVESDIADWTPGGSGRKTGVNAGTWRNLKLAWPNGDPAEQTDAYWYLYWMQSMPGRSNTIAHGARQMTNWWAFTGDWDAAIRGGIGLHDAPGFYDVSVTGVPLGAAGGTAAVNISGSGGRWIASSNNPWLRLTGNAFGSTPATVQVRADPNPNAEERTGTLAIAGRSVAVVQGARECSFQFTPGSIGFTAAGGSAPLRVSVSPADCGWSSKSDAGWVKVEDVLGPAGSRAVIVTADANPSFTPRTAKLTIGGRDISVTQAGSQRPAVAAAGVLNAATLSRQPGISPYTWITLVGENFARFSRPWQDRDFVNGRLPIELDGTRVIVNGEEAYVSYISPKQINALLPPGVRLGTATVEVAAPEGRSDPIMVDIAPVSPALFPFEFRERTHVAAVHSDGVYAGPAGLLGPGVLVRPAQPGGTILVFGTGFGPTSPRPVAGAAATGSLGLIEPALAFVGGRQAQVAFAGIVSPGLFQFNVRIPSDIPPGDHVFNIKVGAAFTPDLLLRVE